MKRQRKLIIDQLERRYAVLKSSVQGGIPQGGWMRTIRSALGFTLEQLAERLGVTRQHVSQLEKREANGTLSLKSLREAANALDMDLYYALVPKDGSLQALVDRRAQQLAQEIVMRTHQTMKLEGQAVSEQRLKEAIEEQVADLKREMPKRLWD